MNTKPRPGEKVSSCRERYAHELLKRAGASDTEAQDRSDVLAMDPQLMNMSIADAKTRLDDWREEMRAVAGHVREDRRRRIAAGYAMGLSPVHLDGATEWLRLAIDIIEDLNEQYLAARKRDK